MARLEGTCTRTFVVPVDLDRATRHFADPAAVVAATGDVVRSAIDGDTVHLVLKPQNHGVTTFQPDYRCRYRVAGDTVRWATTEGNTWQAGEARFRPVAGGTEVTYTETVAVELPIPRLMVPMLRPVVSRMVASEVNAYLDRMIAALR